MEQTTLYIVIAVCCLLGLCALLIRSRMRKGEFSLTGIFTGAVEGSDGPSVEGNTAKGDDNKFRAEGSGATTNNNYARGKGNEFETKT